MTSPPDFGVHTTCFLLVKNLLSVWSSSGALRAGGGDGSTTLAQWVARDVTTHMFRFLTTPHFQLSDPNCISSIRAWLDLQKSMHRALGDEYLTYLANDFLPNTLRIPSNVGHEYARVLVSYQGTGSQQSGNEWKSFENFFKLVVNTAKGGQQTPTSPHRNVS
jgi:hypothetical protein